VAGSEVAKLQKAAAEEYTQACKAYLEAKKDNPSEPKPVKTTVTVLEKSVKGKDNADALAAKYRDKYEAAQAKKAGTETTDTGAKPTEDKPVEKKES
jgi:hypothetical protein